MTESLYGKFRDKVYEYLTFEPPLQDGHHLDFNRLKHEMRPGDVILVEGRSRVSGIIRSITNSSWTHAALYIGRANSIDDEATQQRVRQYCQLNENKQLLIEDLLDRGTVIEDLDVYSKHHIRICRPIGLTPDDTQQVINYAVKALGQPYNVRHLLDLMRYLLPWSILPRRWGSSLFRTVSGQDDSSICSSLIAEAFSAVQFPILPAIKTHADNSLEVFHRNPHLFTPKDFDDSPYFAVIKHPIIDPEEPLPYYRRLPWSQRGLLYQDKGILREPQPKKVRKIKLFRRNVKNPINPETPVQSEKS